jgi:hypothetical protein
VVGGGDRQKKTDLRGKGGEGRCRGDEWMERGRRQAIALRSITHVQGGACGKMAVKPSVFPHAIPPHLTLTSATCRVAERTTHREQVMLAQTQTQTQGVFTSCLPS